MHVRVRQVLMGGCTFSVALGIGFVMQNGDALAARFAGDAPQQTPVVAVDSAPDDQAAAFEIAVESAGAEEMAVVVPADIGAFDAATNVLGQVAIVATNAVAAIPAQFTLPDEVVAPVLDMTGLHDLPELHLAALETSEISGPTLTEVSPVADCGVTLAATPAQAAMVALVLDAPCAPDSAATIHHQGMMFTVLTDAEGRAEVIAPALEQASVFLAAFDDGEGAVATVMVPELATFDRAVLQWQGLDGLQIHAREFGAGYGEVGHIWSGATGSAEAFAEGGGFLVALGEAGADNALLAEVYTFPSGESARAGAVALTVEAEVTLRNCGREISAQAIQISPGELPRALDLTMTMPGCDTLGEFLVLDTMLEDLVIAAN